MEKIRESQESIPGYRKVFELNGQQLGIRLSRGAIHDVLTMEEVASGKEIATANTQSS